MKDHIGFFLSILLFVFFMLAGCSSMLMVSSAAFVATTWYDSRTIGSQLDDSVLKIQVYRILNQNEQIKKFTRIASTVYQGNVLLTGQSPSIFFSKEAVKIVMKIHGIKNIYNAIRQNQPISSQKVLIDTWIGSKVRLSLFTQKNMRLSNIKVVVEDKEVFLLGKVTHQEGRDAEMLSRNISGVRNVFSAFIYIN